MRKTFQRSLSLLLAIILLIGLSAAGSVTIGAAAPQDYTYFAAATEGNTIARQKLVSTETSNYYALRMADGSPVGEGNITFKAISAIEAYNFKTIMSNVGGYNGTWSFFASTDGKKWTKLTPTSEKTDDHVNAGWQAGYYDNYGTLNKSDGYLYLRATISGNTQDLPFPAIAGVAYSCEPALEDISTFKGTDISMGVGKTATERGFSWQATIVQRNGAVKIVESSKMNGKKFPADARIVKGTATATATGYHIKVTVDGLKPNTEYTYACGDSAFDVWSAPYTFKVDDTTDGYKAIFIGDPQVGASGSYGNDASGLEDTLYRANRLASDAAFVLCAGDQVDYGGPTTYGAVLSPPQLKKWAFVPTVGNHEWTGEMSHYFYMPNQTGLGATADASDYYFSYGNTLYIVLNGSNSSIAEHRQAMEKAIKSHPDAIWRVVMFHEDVYGFGTHALAPEDSNYSTAFLRRALVPVLDELDIDLVLNGHDHFYTRSHFMKNQQPITNNKTAKDGGFIKPEGTLYITGGCSSDAKYYNVGANLPNWVNKVCTEKKKTFSVIEVTDNSLSIKTYFAEKSLGLVDEVTIYQKEPATLPSTTTKPTTSSSATASTNGHATTTSTSSSASTSTHIGGDEDTTTKNDDSAVTTLPSSDSTTTTATTSAVSGDKDTADGDNAWMWFLSAIPVAAVAVVAIVLVKRKSKAEP